MSAASFKVSCCAALFTVVTGETAKLAKRLRPFPHRHAPWHSATAQVSHVAPWEN